jgi:hypothetical protein
VSRVPQGIRALIVCFVALVVAIVGYVRSDPIIDAADTRQPVPTPPPAPKHATERYGPASDGGRAIVRRSGDWIWVRIESEPSENCRPGGSIMNGYVHAESPPAIRRDGSFEFRNELWNTFQVKTTGKRLPHKLDNEPFHITYRITGRVDAKGVARGTFERHDEIYHGGEVAQECHRRSTWTATRSRGR